MKICIYDPNFCPPTNITKALKGVLPTLLFRLLVSRLKQSKEQGDICSDQIWPHPRWWHVPHTFQPSELYHSSPLKSMQFPTSSRSSPLWGFLRSEDFNSKPSSSSNSSPLISADDYATIYSSTFIKCDTTQHGQLWVMKDFSTCNPNK